MVNRNRESDASNGAQEASGKEATASLYADADLANRNNSCGTEPVDMTGVTEDHYVRATNALARTQMGLPITASAEDVYRQSAQSVAETFRDYGTELKAEAMRELGLSSADMSNANKVFNAMVERDRRETGLGANATLKDVETAMRKKEYEQLVRTGKMEIDCD